jgi:hypothetical protein
LHGHQDLAPSGSERVETITPGVPDGYFVQSIEPNPMDCGMPL